MGMSRNKAIIAWCTVASLLAVAAVATMEEDEKDCADQLANLAACIPYVSGSAKKPTQQCCADTRKVKTAKPKCLCVLIKESTDPSMGLPVNTTLALQMPSACKIDAKVSDCPSLLNLPPDSPDAKIFKGTDAGSGTTTTADSQTTAAATSSGTPSSSSSSSGTGSSSDRKATTNSNGEKKLSLSKFLMMTGFASVAFSMYI